MVQSISLASVLSVLLYLSRFLWGVTCFPNVRVLYLVKCPCLFLAQNLSTLVAAVVVLVQGEMAKKQCLLFYSCCSFSPILYATSPNQSASMPEVSDVHALDGWSRYPCGAGCEEGAA